jgi:predicted nucleic acid-binding protein
MKILVDTCVWSHALRHKSPDKKIIDRLTDLINDDRVTMIGPIRQELLSGISSAKSFEQLKEVIAVFDDTPLITSHFEKAAEFCNYCRSKGIQGSSVDYLICAVAYINKYEILTLDKDFIHYAKHLPIRVSF